MHRRSFIKSVGLASGGILAGLPASSVYSAPASKLKITRIRYYSAPGYTKPLFNQARGIVEIQTDGGITGIGEGGSPDNIAQCAEMLIGADPFRIEHLWQYLYRGMFYPPGREKLHALGAIEMALWDIKGKALNVPVYELLGGATREFVECYATGFSASNATSEEGRAKDCLRAGLRCYRIGIAGGNDPNVPFDFYENAVKTIDMCKSIDKAVGGNGRWAIDLHTRFDLTEGIMICKEIEKLQPYFVEDIIRSENPGVYKTVRSMTTVPIAVGEQFGDRWDINELIEQRLIDYARVTLPNVGGISEFKKIAALCETHYVGMIPHFTGPLSTAALVHALGSSSFTRCLVELAGGAPEQPAYFNNDLVDFRNGKLYLNSRPGLGVSFTPEKAKFLFETTANTKYPHPYLKAPDGSIHNW